MSQHQQPSCRIAALPDRAVLHVAGADAEKFLQGLLTNDLSKVDQTHAIHAGLLSPQGKILFDVFVVRKPDGDGYLIETPRAQREALAKRLSFYRLRADVEIAETPDLTVAAAWDAAPNVPAGVASFPDPRLAALGYRILLPENASLDDLFGDLSCHVTAEDAYHAHRIALGVPEGGRDYQHGDTFPHEALFDHLNGVDFAKGCFVGQEVVSRMEHRGTARKRIVPVEGRSQLLSGAEVTAGSIPIGTIGSVDDRRGLALLRLDRAKDAIAKGDQLKAGDANLVLRQPAFASFEIPEAGHS